MQHWLCDVVLMNAVLRGLLELKLDSIEFLSSTILYLQACCLYPLRLQWLEASTLSAPFNHLYGLNK